MNESDDYSRGFSAGYNGDDLPEDSSNSFENGYYDGQDQRDRDNDDWDDDDYYEYNEFPEPGEDM